MSLQNLILKEFKENHPEATFRQISEMTGIQITRVFRIFNGSKMKINEWEAFQKLSNPSDQGVERGEVLELAQRLLQMISPHGVSEIKYYLGRKYALLEQRGQRCI